MKKIRTFLRILSIFLILLSSTCITFCFRRIAYILLDASSISFSNKKIFFELLFLGLGCLFLFIGFLLLAISLDDCLT